MYFIVYVIHGPPVFSILETSKAANLSMKRMKQNASTPPSTGPVAMMSVHEA